jgi:hypothetical protein
VAVVGGVETEQDGAESVACLVLAPGALPAGAIRRASSLEDGALKPQVDDGLVGGKRRGLTLDGAKARSYCEGVGKESVSVGPGARAEVLAGQLEEVKGDELQAAGGVEVASQRGVSDSGEVLYGGDR